MKSTRGVIQAVWLLAGAVVLIFALVPSWHLPSFLVKKPETKQLTQAQVDLASANKRLADAQAKLDAAQAQQAQKTHDQTAYAQQMIAGVPVALAHAPQLPEVVLASQLAQRAQNGLAAAIGDLPADKQAEITAIVGQALSAKQAEVDAANKALASKDAELASETTAKKALEASISPLQASVVAANAQVGVKTALVDQKTAEVVAYANQAAAEKEKAGSLSIYASNLFRIILICGILYLIIHVVLPCVAAEFPGATWLTSIYRFWTSLTSAHTVSVPAPTVAQVPTISTSSK